MTRGPDDEVGRGGCHYASAELQDFVWVRYGALVALSIPGPVPELQRKLGAATARLTRSAKLKMTREMMSDTEAEDILASSHGLTG